ncbi:MAG TPA: hypothetical protein VLV32_02430 [Burkholderiales bacterium]|nr:hypothetical protein [Burkholderiales bacterium]
MNRNVFVGIVVFFMLALPGCTSDELKRSTYEALYQKQCMDRSGTPNCDPEHKSYDEYRNEREDAFKEDH